MQAIDSHDATEHILRSLLFYTVNLEAFIFCYVGEYINNKVRDEKIIMNIMIILRLLEEEILVHIIYFNTYNLIHIMATSFNNFQLSE